MLSSVTEHPARDVRVLLGFLEQREPEFYFLHPDYALSETVCKQLDGLIRRRLCHEPLSKIVGRREFYGRLFKVTADTLDPRSDTETLIDAALKYQATFPTPLRVIDLGTGTGCILLTLLAEMSDATGVAIDISEKALAVARSNAVICGVHDRVYFLQSDWLTELDPGEKFSLIVSNPPYIGTDEPLDPSVYAYDPHRALFSGENGLEAYLSFIPCLRNHLLPNGKVIVEFGRGQEDTVRRLFEAHSFRCIEHFKDINEIIRCAIFAYQ